MNRRSFLGAAAALAMLPHLAQAGMDTNAQGLAVRATPLIGPARFSNRRVYKPFNQNTQTVSAGAGTAAATMALEGDFFRVRLTLYNFSTTTVATVTGVCVAPTADANSGAVPGITPTNGSGVADNTLWKQAAYQGTVISGSAPVNVPVGTATGGGSNVIPGTLQLDWLICQSIPRADGSPNTMIMYRVATNTTASLNTVLAPTGALTTGWPAVNGGRFFQSYGGSGDFASGSQGGWGAAVRDTVAPAVGLECQGGRRGLSVMTCGDSTFQGANTTAGQNNFGHQAALLATSSACAVSHINVGFSGQQHAAIYQNALNSLALYTPDVLVFEGYSPNDGYTVAAAEAALGRCVDIIEQCIKVGTIPVIEPPIPWGGSSGTALTSAQEAIRLGVRAVLLTWKLNGTIIMDNEGILSNGAAIASLKPQYRVYDGLAITPDAGGQHPDNNGHAARAGSLNVILQNIIGRKPVALYGSWRGLQQIRKSDIRSMLRLAMANDNRGVMAA
jgi:hypothetical protein